MKPLSISETARKIFPIHTKRELIDLKDTDFTSVAAVILTKNDLDWDKKYMICVLIYQLLQSLKREMKMQK